MKKRMFAFREMRQLSGFAASSLDRLLDLGSIEPLHRGGNNNARRYSAQAAFGACVASNLSRLGASFQVQLKSLIFCARADLARRFQSGERFLVCAANGDTLWLASEKSVFESAQSGAVIAMDLLSAWNQFVDRAGPGTESEPEPKPQSSRQDVKREKAAR